MPSGVRRNTRLSPRPVQYTVSSGPRVRSNGKTKLGIGANNSPDVLMRPMDFAVPESLNHRFPPGPFMMKYGACLPGGAPASIGKSVIVTALAGAAAIANAATHPSRAADHTRRTHQV